MTIENPLDINLLDLFDKHFNDEFFVTRRNENVTKRLRQSVMHGFGKRAEEKLPLRDVAAKRKDEIKAMNGVGETSFALLEIMVHTAGGHFKDEADDAEFLRRQQNIGQEFLAQHGGFLDQDRAAIDLYRMNEGDFVKQHIRNAVSGKEQALETEVVELHDLPETIRQKFAENHVVYTGQIVLDGYDDLHLNEQEKTAVDTVFAANGLDIGLKAKARQAYEAQRRRTPKRPMKILSDIRHYTGYQPPAPDAPA